MVMPVFWSAWAAVEDCACADAHRMQARASCQLIRRIALIGPLRKRYPTERRRETPATTPSKIVEEDYSPASFKSLFSVGLCLSPLSLRFLLAGSARVGGGVPIA